jgi:hypothetical protein
VAVALLSLLLQLLSFLALVTEMVVFIFWLLFRLSAATTDVASCSCGFFDPRTGAVWTDAIVTYANETEKLPADSLIAEDFQHANEKNWNARYRAGASAANVGHNGSTAPGWNGSAWTLSLDRPTRDHAVVGASIRSLRRDLRYGTFEAALGPPTPGVGGSVLAMRLDYNETQTLNVNVMNADDPKDAWTSFMMYGDWRGTRSKGVNFTDFGNSTYNFPSSPWGFVPYRIDWTDQKADFFLGDALVRSVSARAAVKWPMTGSTLHLRHSSIGDAYTSEGPPPNGSYAHVGMLRAFFNSSLMSAADHAVFDARCREGTIAEHLQCLVSDTRLRGASPYSHAATVAFKERPIDYKKRWPAIFVASICIAISTVLLVHALVKRAPWRTKTPASADGSNDLSITPSMIFSGHHGLAYAAQLPGTGTPGAATPGTLTPGGYCSRPISSSASPGSSSLQVPPLPAGISINRTWNVSDETTLASSGKPLKASSPGIRSSLEVAPINEQKRAGRFFESTDEKKLPEVKVEEIDVSNAASAGAKPPISAPKQRVDYLAGLVSICFLQPSVS